MATPPQKADDGGTIDAAQALHEEHALKTVVVFGRSTELWQEPYEAVVVVLREEEHS